MMSSDFYITGISLFSVIDQRKSVTTPEDLLGESSPLITLQIKSWFLFLVDTLRIALFLKYQKLFFDRFFLKLIVPHLANRKRKTNCTKT